MTQDIYLMSGCILQGLLCSSYTEAVFKHLVWTQTLTQPSISRGQMLRTEGSYTFTVRNKSMSGLNHADQHSRIESEHPQFQEFAKSASHVDIKGDSKWIEADVYLSETSDMESHLCLLMVGRLQANCLISFKIKWHSKDSQWEHVMRPAPPRKWPNRLIFTFL